VAPTALVLSGGGSHGAFQVGAVRYLYTEKQVRPEIICASSVGSINGVKLAEADQNTPNDHMQKLNELLGLWRSMKTRADMTTPTDFMEQHPALRDLTVSVLAGTDLKQYLLEGVPTNGDEVWQLAQRVLMAGAGYNTVRTALEVSNAVARALNAVNIVSSLPADFAAFLETKQQSILTLDPMSKMLNDNVVPAKVAASGVRLRLAVVSLEATVVRYVTEDGRLLERDNKTEVTPLKPPGGVPSACQSLADAHEAAFVEWQAASVENASAVTVAERIKADQRLADASDKLGAARDALDLCVASNPPPPPRVPLLQGVLASSSIPVAFPPVDLFGEMYVDGGVRELLPVHAAADLGADDIYAISCSALMPAHQEGSYANRGAFDIAAQSGALIYDELAQDEVTVEMEWIRTLTMAPPPPKPRPDGAFLAGATRVQQAVTGAVRSTGLGRAHPRVVSIAPATNFYSIIDIDPAFVEANMAYGWMRAYEAVENVPQTDATADDLVTALVRHAVLTKALTGFPFQVPGAVTQSDVDTSQAAIRAMRDARTAKLGPASVPPEAAGW